MPQNSNNNNNNSVVVINSDAIAIPQPLDQGHGRQNPTMIIKYDADGIPLPMTMPRANQLKLENALNAVKMDRDRMIGHGDGGRTNTDKTITNTFKCCSCKLNPANKRNLMIGIGIVFIIGSLIGIYMYWIVSGIYTVCVSLSIYTS